MTQTPPDQSMPFRSLLPSLFSSLARGPSTPQTWTLLRTLKSENPNDIQGDLHGTATFTKLETKQTQSQESSQEINTTANTPTDAEQDTKNTDLDLQETHKDLLYSESGSLPLSFGPGLQWTKKYIWRLADDKISVWFVKPDTSTSTTKTSSTSSTSPAEKEQRKQEEADYLFHEFDFEFAADAQALLDSAMDEEFVNPPLPPDVEGSDSGGVEKKKKKTRIIAARGNHLCVEDMYRTAYAFRICEGSGEVVSWASRHVVRGPRKGQDIVNLYSRAS